MNALDLSKYLSYVLRHNPDDCGIELDDEGWTDLNQLIEKMNKKNRFRITKRDIEYVVSTNNKKRFTIEGGKIRASQGHSVKNVMAVDLTPKVPPNILYHGTTMERLPSIKKQGLKPMERHHVHLSASHDQAKIVADRWKKETPIIVVVNSKLMHQAGHKFFISDNGVWMADHVPSEFIYD